MYRDLRVAVVVPAFNEERLIAKTLSTMPDFVDRIFVIDDCSTDATLQRARQAADQDDRVVVLHHELNTGVGGAIMTGHRHVLNEEDLAVSVVMAGDAQMDPEYLPALLDPIVDDGVGFTKANRFYNRTSTTGMPFYRVFGNVVLSIMTKFASGYYHLFDPQNGYTAITRRSLSLLDLDAVDSNYSFETAC